MFKHHTDESKEKMRRVKLGTNNPMFGRTHTIAARQAISVAKLGQHRSNATKKKISIAHIGKHLSAATKEKMKFANLGSKNPMFGKHISKKHKQIISKLHKGKIISDWHRDRIKQAHLGMKHTEEARQKMRIGRLNVVIPRKDTKIELALQKELKRRKIKFKKHVALIGQPDIFIEPNICIFADGDFYHGNPSKYNEDSLIGIGRTRCNAKIKWDKDADITTRLTNEGYEVLRFWETDINKNIKLIGDKIQVTL